MLLLLLLLLLPIIGVLLVLLSTLPTALRECRMVLDAKAILQVHAFNSNQQNDKSGSRGEKKRPRPNKNEDDTYIMS